MARASKPEPAAHEAAARRATRPRRTERHARPAPTAVPGTARAQPTEVEAPGSEPLLAAPVFEAPGGEPPTDAAPPAASLPPEASAPEATAPDAPAPEPASAAAEPIIEPGVPADRAALPQVRDLHGITLRFWQDQLERTLATGQAIMLCRSPQEAVCLQIAYVQASVASGFEHAGRAARLSQDIARDMLPLRPR
jgi:hypothetical protein